MEYVEGRSLRAILAQDGRLPPARALHLLRQIGAALAFAHGLEIVHRDLKPENVMVFERGDERDLVKVIDFGIARMRSSFGGGPSGLTQVGTVVGTVEYMAPEQAMGQAVDARADQYALGVIAFELLTGQPPYVADDVASLVYMHVGAPIPRVTERAPELPAGDRRRDRADDGQAARRALPVAVRGDRRDRGRAQRPVAAVPPRRRRSPAGRPPRASSRPRAAPVTVPRAAARPLTTAPRRHGAAPRDRGRRAPRPRARWQSPSLVIISVRLVRVIGARHRPGDRRQPLGSSGPDPASGSAASTPARPATLDPPSHDPWAGPRRRTRAGRQAR